MFLQIVLSRFSHSSWTFKAQERPKYCKLCELILYDLLNSPFGRTICYVFICLMLFHLLLFIGWCVTFVTEFKLYCCRTSIEALADGLVFPGAAGDGLKNWKEGTGEAFEDEDACLVNATENLMIEVPCVMNKALGSYLAYFVVECVCI